MLRRTLGTIMVALLTAAMLLPSVGVFAADAPAAAKAGALARYVAPEFFAALVIHPQRIKDSDLAKALPPAPGGQAGASPLAPMALMMLQSKLPKDADVAKLAQVLKPATIHRVVLLLDPCAGGKAEQLSAAGIVQFNADVDGAAILAAGWKNWEPAESNGVKYQKSKEDVHPGMKMAACAPDARTILLAPEPTMIRMLATSGSSQPLLEQLRRTSLNHDIILELVAEPALAQVAKASGKPAEQFFAEKDPVSAEFFKKVKGFSLTLDFSGATLLHSEVTTASEETAAEFAAMASGGLEVGKMQFAAMKEQIPPMVPEAAKKAMIQFGDELLATLTVKAAGAKTVADLPMPKSLPDLLKQLPSLAPALLPMMMGGGGPMPGGPAPAPPEPPRTPEPAKPPM